MTENMKAFWNRDDVKKILNALSVNRSVDLSLNPFAIAVEQGEFCKEKYHSGIIAALLRDNASTAVFVEYLKRVAAKRNEQCLSKLKDFTVSCDDEVFVEVEQATGDGFIDVLLVVKKHDSDRKCAVIIENKINTAPDLDRQLPRYYDFCVGKSAVCGKKLKGPFDVLAEVYLVANGNADNGSVSPSQSEWTDSDKENVRRVLLPIVGWAAGDELSLYDGWIRKVMDLCEQRSENEKIVVFKKYGDLLLAQVGSADVDKLIMDVFAKAAEAKIPFADMFDGVSNLDVEKCISALARYLRDNCSKGEFGKAFVYDDRQTVFSQFSVGRNRNNKIDFKINVTFAKGGKSELIFPPEVQFYYEIQDATEEDEVARLKGYENVRKLVGDCGGNVFELIRNGEDRRGFIMTPQVSNVGELLCAVGGFINSLSTNKDKICKAVAG